MVYYMHRTGISRDRRGVKKNLKKYGRKYSKFDGNKKAHMFKKLSVSKHNKQKRHNTKLLKTSEKGTILKSAKKKKAHQKTMEHIFKILKENYWQPKILYPAKIPFKKKEY